MTQAQVLLSTILTMQVLFLPSFLTPPGTRTGFSLAVQGIFNGGVLQTDCWFLKHENLGLSRAMVVVRAAVSSARACSSSGGGMKKSCWEQGRRMGVRGRYQRSVMMMLPGGGLLRRKQRAVTSLAAPAPPPPARGDELLELTLENVEMVLDEV